MKRYEFWNAGLFNTPYIVYLLVQCLLRRMSFLTLLKANPVLVNDVTNQSKYELQKILGEQLFPKTLLLKKNGRGKEKKVLAFMKQEQLVFPVLFKPDNGRIGKAVVKIRNKKELTSFLQRIKIDLLCQEFIDCDVEYGVFYVHVNGKSTIPSINKKVFPEIVGDGKSTLLELAKKHLFYSAQWKIFLKYHDIQEVLPLGKKRKLSFIGSHTMGCQFFDATAQVTPALRKKLFSILDPIEGFNFGRVDIKARSVAEFKKGHFRIIEVNGAISMATNMFDPSFSVFDAYKIYFAHGKLLATVAQENRHAKVSRPTLRQFFSQLRNQEQGLEEQHQIILARDW